MDGWECVYSGKQFFSIEIIKSELEEHSISSVFIDKRDSNYVGVGEIELYVQSSDAILAKIIIDQLAL
jgi:hypothetical protein